MDPKVKRVFRPPRGGREITLNNAGERAPIRIRTKSAVFATERKTFAGWLYVLNSVRGLKNRVWASVQSPESHPTYQEGARSSQLPLEFPRLANRVFRHWSTDTRIERLFCLLTRHARSLSFSTAELAGCERREASRLSFRESAGRTHPADLRVFFGAGRGIAIARAVPVLRKLDRDPGSGDVHTAENTAGDVRPLASSRGELHVAGDGGCHLQDD